MHIAGANALPTRLLSYTVSDGELVPAWLSERDRPWLRDLLFEAQAFVGRPFGELAERFRRTEPDPRAGRRQAMASHVLTSWLRRTAVVRSMTQIRRELFQVAASAVDRQQALDEVARRHGVTAATLATSLFADLPANRIVQWPDPPPEPSLLSWSTNLALVRGMLRHAHGARIQLLGGTRALLKTAWLLGLATAVDSDPNDGTSVTWRCDGSTMSAGAIGSLVALLPWARRYQLSAECRIRGDRGELVMATGDPILPGPEPRLYDSLLEQNFARDFARAMSDWQLLREPTAIRTEHGLAFPDFELRPRNGQAHWLCELAGLRDPRALPAKLALLASHRRLVLCLPHRLVPEAMRGHARIVAFRRRVCIEMVRAIIEAGGP